MQNLKAKIFSTIDRKEKQKVVEKWGVTVNIRSMSARMRERVMIATAGKNEDERNIAIFGLFPDLIIDGTYDQDGEKVFNANDRENLLDMDGDVLQDLALEIINMSGIEAKAVDTAKKDS